MRVLLTILFLSTVGLAFSTLTLATRPEAVPDPPPASQVAGGLAGGVPVRLLPGDDLHLLRPTRLGVLVFVPMQEPASVESLGVIGTDATLRKVWLFAVAAEEKPTVLLQEPTVAGPRPRPPTDRSD